ncbi:LuxR family transcriptional regulator [Ruegeria sp. R13_0]|jgi:LuxR family transcriptional regulator|uniref:LuxR family transcriptional regulator n=1 Tax=Ruegeria sp. R13_0 TaxID=2821099 RepID=UPI001ADC6D6F|nr:LuxR family transcriptional regulator [Ruegeria sp. R13_0]MBO9436493.1 LuxR family transcriptional regulator [Ruegeria sp. R13_0]
MKLKEYLRFVSYARTLEELWDAHCRQMATYGFDRLIYGYTQYRTATSLGDPEDFVILSNHRREYVDGFLGDSRYFNAPMLQWALNNDGAASWGMIQDWATTGDLTPEQQKVVDFNKSHNVLAGYTVSFNSVSVRSKGAISLSAAENRNQDEIDAMWEEHGEDILLMNNIAHLKILTLPYTPPNRSLTKRQREALQWVGDGKTTQDIALLMGLTAATVEKHLRLARESLSVETTAQAVLKAALHNQMYVMEA